MACTLCSEQHTSAILNRRIEIRPFSPPPIKGYTCVRSASAQSCSCSALGNPFSILIACRLMSWALFRQASTTHLACRSRHLQHLRSVFVACHARAPLLSPRLPGRHVVLLSRTRGTTGLQPDRGLRFLRYSLRFSISIIMVDGPSKTADGPSKYLRDLLP